MTKTTELLLAFLLGAGLAIAYYERAESTLNTRWQVVTGTTIEEAEARIKACQPCVGVLATHRGKR